MTDLNPQVLIPAPYSFRTPATIMWFSKISLFGTLNFEYQLILVTYYSNEITTNNKFSGKLKNTPHCRDDLQET